MKIQLAVAVALAAPILAVAPPAQAACGQFAFTGYTAINQSNGYRVEFNSVGTTASGTATAFNNRQAAVMHGPISGGINGREVNLTVMWSQDSGGFYSGSVDDSGKARGETTAGTPSPDDTVSRATWNIRDPLKCAE